MDQIRVVGEREEGAFGPVDPGRHQLPVHQRPVGGDLAGAEAGDPRAEHQLDEQDSERDQRGAGEASGARLRVAGKRAQIERGPQQCRHQEQGQKQMRRQAIGTDFGAAFKARYDHQPADQPLHPAEHEQDSQTRPVARWNLPLPREPQQGQREHQPDDPAEQAVDPFPEEDELEPVQGHSGGGDDFAILGGRLVQIEGVVPVGLGKRRNRPRQRFPLGDAEPAFGQPGDPADNDHREHHQCDHEQEVGDCGWAGGASRAGHRARLCPRGGDGGKGEGGKGEGGTSDRM